MSCELDKMPEMPNIHCGNVNVDSGCFQFVGDICYKNNKKHGKVIHKDEDSIRVEVNNGNRYMKGQIIEFKFI